MADFFPYAVDNRLAPFWLPFGLHRHTDGVTITPDGNFVARFGFMKMETPLTNINGTSPATTGGGPPPVHAVRWSTTG